VSEDPIVSPGWKSSARTISPTLVAAQLHPWFESRIVHHFRPADFSPAPGVDVVLLRLQHRDAPRLDPVEIEGYGDFVAHLFSAWKPTVREALRGIVTARQVAGLEREIGRSLMVAPGDLPDDAWISLFRVMQAHCGKSLHQVTGARARLERQQAGLQKEHRTRCARPQGRRA
jgi:16S rRNA A1518/A1519 N6-dimethyltransferase RsmA/KsgA/DIM1 with predicted DNA glycosylase/AP lyase activity